MSKPPAIARAIERADRARWAAGREARTKHINALETQARESDEDYREMCAKHAEQSRRLNLETQIAALRIQRDAMAAHFCWSPLKPKEQ